LNLCIVVLVNGLTTAYVDAQLQDGLVSHWSFDEESGTIASDSSGNNNTATLVNGPIWTSGEIRGALSFDGVNDYVSFASQAQSTLSISAWVYARLTPGNVFPRIIDMPGYVLFLAEPGAPNSNSQSLGFISRRSVQDGTWNTPANSITYNSWNHIAVVYDSSSTLNNPDLYVNGIKQTISRITSPQGTQSSNEGEGMIGNRIPLNRGWDGLIDELRIYNRALSATEIVFFYDQANSGPFNFALANSMNLSVTQGSSATNTITASLVSGLSQPVSFSTVGLPSGASASFSQKTCSLTCSSLLTIETTASTPAGTYTITVTGTGGDVTKTTSFTLTVNASTTTFDFSLSNSGNSSVSAGSSVTNTVSATLVSGSTQLVAFSAAGQPTGTTASFSAAGCSPGCSSTLTLNTTGSTPAGNFPITVTATGGGVTRTTILSLTVSSPTIIPTVATIATVATPTISPNGGSFTGSVSVTLQTATSGALIFYTTDGSTPTQSSTLYTGAFTLTSSATVNAIAFQSGSNPSAQASANFTTVAPSAQLTLTWQDNSNNEDDFTIERKTGTNGAYSQIASVAANVTSYIDTSVTPGVTYCYRIQAINSGGASGYTNDACKAAP
jgi:hypothetical protein